MNLEKLLRPRSVAVIGASEKPGFGLSTCTNLLRSSRQEHIYFIHPKRESVLGKKCYKRIADLPEQVDMCIILLNKSLVIPALEEAAASGCRAAIVYASGYGETGDREAERELRETAQRLDMAVMGVNCAGYISNNDDLFPFGMIVKRDARPGNIAIISQSGKICLNMMQVDYMNFSYLISAGNCSCLLVEDYIDYLIDDPGTKVIGLYLEGVKDPEKFTAVLRRAAVIKKPIVILKVGRSSAGSRVASSHTGSLSGSDKAFDALCKKFGIVRVDDIEELVQTCHTLSVLPSLPEIPTISAMCLSGGGTRMHPSVTREEVMRLAEIMAYKYNAAGIPDCGGCKAGIVYDNKAPDARDVLKRFFAAMRPYVEIGLALGNDLGTTGPEIAAIRSELGMATMTETKSQLQDMQMRANMQKKAKLLHEKYDVFTVNDAMTGYGTAACADVAWRKLHGAPNGAKVLVQGFGNVGASAAYRLHQLGYKVVGISDARQLVVCEDGLDVPYLYEHRTPYLEMDTETLKAEYKVLPNTEWMNVECDIFIPAALEAVINKDTVNKITATVISEGANIPTTEEADEVLKTRGVCVIPDFIANLGAIRFHGYARLGLIDFTPESAIGDVIRCSEENTERLFAEQQKTGEYFRDIAYRLFAPTKQSEFEF